MNTICAIRDDMNAKQFFDKLFYHIKNYDQLEHMEKYYFNNDFKYMQKVISSLFYTVLKYNETKDKSANEIIKPARIFNDYIGKTFIRICGYYSVMVAFNDKFINEKLLKEKMNEKEIEEYIKQKRSYTFESSFLKNKLKEKEYFIDEKTYQKYIEFKTKPYIERKESIEYSINLIINAFEQAEDKNDFIIKVGSIFWDQKQLNEKERTEKINKTFTDIFSALINNKNNTEKE